MKADHYLSSSSTEITRGTTLVEASAGTGKTFAISMHVLRAVTELEITIDRILVVTFTVAATEELRERIRARLISGRNILKNPEDEYDDVLREWADRVRDKGRTVKLLEMALLDIDCIGVYTIHGFCQRMLTEQPLESGQLFDVELVSDAQLIKKEVVNDYWRARLYQLDEQHCSLITDCYPDPEALYNSIAGAEDLLTTLIPEPQPISDCCHTIDRVFLKFKVWWMENGRTLKTRLDQASSDGYLNKELNNNYQIWCQAVEQCVQTSTLPDPAIVGWMSEKRLFTQLNGSRLRGLEKKKAYSAGWNLPSQEVDWYLEAVDELVLQVRLELAGTLRKTFPEKLEQLGEMTFDDLVTRLAAAVSGPHGGVLRRKIRQRFQMILIDEFQDTDSAQWHIFDTLFNTADHILYLIGDPKQAIYRFRGADIVSYFHAREHAKRTLTLHQNFRSHPDLMEAVNDLFSGIHFSGLHYKRLQPVRRIEDGRLVDDDFTTGALVYCQLERRSEGTHQWSGGAAHQRIRKWVVSEIARLITQKSEVMIEYVDPAEGVCKTSIKPADIAILVRTNRQAQEYHDELSALSIPSVVASKTSVFSTAECEQLLRVMHAVADPAEIGGLKAAVSCDWFQTTGADLALMTTDETLVEQWVEKYQTYRQVWQRDGFLCMILKLLTDEKVFIHLSELDRGERRIANIQHLSELVQETARLQGLSIEQTITWLQKMASSRESVEEMELRLESDADAVAIVTMHGAKGLEFPVVFCPYLMAGGRTAQKNQLIAKCHDDTGRLVVDLGSHNFEENSSRAQEEEAEEDLRLAYVAITRARLRCYLFWADIKGWGGGGGSFLSPLGTLLFPGGQCDFDSQHEQLQQQASHGGASHLLLEDEAGEVCVYEQPADTCKSLRIRDRGNRSFSSSKSLTSFSGLVNFSIHGEDVHAGAFDERNNNDEVLESSRLPGGVRFGNLVHDALELIDFPDLADGRYDQAQLSQLCQKYGLDLDQNILKQLLHNAVTTRLVSSEQSGKPFSLADIVPAQQVKELEFSLYIAPATTEDVNRILGSEQTYIPLMYREMEGYLNGYIDLICVHGDKYYVIDYKTNHLGEGAADYGRDELIAAMRAHNYGLQYWLYSLVVHRYLSRWQVNYSYKEHFGGVMYLFVRGMVPETDGSGVFHTRPNEQLLTALDRCFGDKT